MSYKHPQSPDRVIMIVGLVTLLVANLVANLVGTSLRLVVIFRLHPLRFTLLTSHLSRRCITLPLSSAFLFAPLRMCNAIPLPPQSRRPDLVIAGNPPTPLRSSPCAGRRRWTIQAWIPLDEWHTLLLMNFRLICASGSSQRPTTRHVR